MNEDQNNPKLISSLARQSCPKDLYVWNSIHSWLHKLPDRCLICRCKKKPLVLRLLIVVNSKSRWHIFPRRKITGSRKHTLVRTPPADTGAGPPASRRVGSPETGSPPRRTVTDPPPGTIVSPFNWETEWTVRTSFELGARPKETPGNRSGPGVWS